MGVIFTKLTPFYNKYNKYILQNLRYGIWFFAIRFKYFSFLNQFYFKRLKRKLSSSTEAKRDNEFTPLHKAVSLNNFEMTKFLLYKGALVNAKAEYEMTPLHIATRNSSKEMISLLLENGADIEVFARKISPLHLAISNKDIEIAKFLLDKGADTEAKDRYGNTAIFYAVHVHFHSLEMVKLLIERGADFKAKNMSFSTPLSHCTPGKV